MNEKDNLIFDSRPALRNPYIVCGVNGWVNGGDVSTSGVEYLIRQFRGVKFAEMQTSRYHIYQIPGVESLRPIFRMKDGVVVDSYLPKDQFYFATNVNADHDLILFLGNEPSLHWEEYADNIVSLANELGAVRLYTFGGVMDRTPYTREPIVSCACTSVKVRDELQYYNVRFSSREGPATFNTMLLYACQKKKLEGVNFTVRVPYYPEFNITVEYSPKSLKALLVRLNQLMHLDVNFDELNKSISELEGKLDFVRQQNQQFNTYVEELEKDYIEMPYEAPLDISPNEAIRFAEEFLKENKDHPKGQ